MNLGARLHGIHIAAFLFAVTNYLHGLLVPLYTVHLEYSPVMIGLLAGLPYLVQIGFRLTIGALSDHFGDTRVLRIGSLLYIGAPLGLLLSSYMILPGLLVAQLMMGIGHTIFWTISKAYITKIPTGSVAANLSLFNGIINAGKLLGLLGAGMIASVFGYNVAFGVVLATALAVALVIFQLPEFSKPITGPIQLSHLWQLYPKDLNLHGLLISGAFGFIGGTAISLASSFYSVYLRSIGYGEAGVSLLAPMVMLGTLCASIALGRSLDRIAVSPRAMVMVVSVMGAAITMTSFVQHWLPLTLAFLLTGLSGGAGNLMSQMMVRVHSPSNRRGAAMAFSTLFVTLAQLMWPWLIGLFATMTSIPFALRVSGFTLVGVAAIFALGRRKLTWLLTPALTEGGTLK